MTSYDDKPQVPIKTGSDIELNGDKLILIPLEDTKANYLSGF